VFVEDDPNFKGNVAEAAIAFAATRLGLPVYTPLTEHSRYDLVIEIGGKLEKVQCKWGRHRPEEGIVSVQLQQSRCTPGGYVHNSYEAGEVDLVAVYCGALDRCYLLPEPLFVGRRAVYLRLDPTRNGQRACINLASEYEFAGAVAQLEERRAGSAKVRGSSPLSSTSPPPSSIGSNEFRNRLGYYLELAARGHELLVTRRGRPFVKVALA
jgi:PD-(D/E)XK nuclease superfamily protein